MSEPIFLAISGAATEIALVGAIIVPAVTALLVLLRDSPGGARLATGGAALTFLFSVGLLVTGIGPEPPAIAPGELAPNIAVAFEVDLLGGTIAVTVAGAVLVGISTILASHRGSGTRVRPRTLACLLAASAAGLSAAYAANLLVLFVGLQLLTVVTYPLVVHENRPHDRRAGYAYLAYLFAGDLSILAGMRVIYAEARTVTFVSGGIPEVGSVAASDPWIARAAFGLLAVGIATKTALVPLHSWFVRAHTAPTSVFGVAFAVVVLKLGTFTLGRVLLDVFGLETAEVLGLGLPLVVAGTLTVLVAGLGAIGASRLLDRLRYLTLTGGALSIVAFGLLRSPWMNGGVGFIPVHAAALLVAFLAVGRLEELHDRYRARLGSLAGGSLTAVVVIAWIVGLWLSGTAPVDLRWLLLVVALTVAMIAHVVALWPVLIDPDLDIEIGSGEATDALFVAPTIAAPILAVADVWGGTMAALGSAGENVAVGAMNGVRAPGEAVETLLPAGFATWYHDRRESGLSATGTKLGIEGSLYVVVLVLAAGLIVGLR